MFSIKVSISFRETIVERNDFVDSIFGCLICAFVSNDVGWPEFQNNFILSFYFGDCKYNFEYVG